MAARTRLARPPLQNGVRGRTSGAPGRTIRPVTAANDPARLSTSGYANAGPVDLGPKECADAVECLPQPVGRRGDRRRGMRRRVLRGRATVERPVPGTQRPGVPAAVHRSGRRLHRALARRDQGRARPRAARTSCGRRASRWSTPPPASRITDFTTPIKTAAVDTSKAEFNDYWNYPFGVVLAGMLQVSDVTGDARYGDYVTKSLDFVFTHYDYFQRQAAQFGAQPGGLRRMVGLPRARRLRRDGRGAREVLHAQARPAL